MGRGTLGTSRGIAAATSGSIPSAALSHIDQLTAKGLNNLHGSKLMGRGKRYTIGGRSAAFRATLVLQPDNSYKPRYKLTLTDSSGASQTQQSYDFYTLKAAAKKHLGV